MEQLDGKVCVVTGGASGIGLAMATRFRAAGMHVALADIEPAALAGAVAGLGGDGEALGVPCDVTSIESVGALRDAVLDRFGAVHVVCLNAGVAASGSLLDTSLASWRWMIEVNLMGVVHGIEAFGRLLVDQGEGHVVCMASSAGLISAPGLGAYAATKHAVVGLAAVLRDELAPSGVGVSVVCPGLIRSRLFESERNRPGTDEVTHADAALADTHLAMTRQAPGPELVAEAVVDALADDQLFVLPNGGVGGMVRARVDEVLAAMPPDQG